MFIQRRISSVLGNSQRLDGGAMFGNAPRALWTRWATPDALNRIPLACRTFLVEELDGDGKVARRVLLETGVGAFFEPKMRERFGVVEAEHMLLKSLAELGLTDGDIDVVVLSHLHFDHAGGLLSAWQPDAEPELLFPNARFVVGDAAWARSQAPHPRDRASFIPVLGPLLKRSGRLEIIDGQRSHVLGEGYRFHRSDGHTPGMLLTEVETSGGPVIFGGDLIPGTPWVHAPLTMGYDRFPERLVDEKLTLLADMTERGAWLAYTHDPDVAMSQVERDARGRFQATGSIERAVGWGV